MINNIDELNLRAPNCAGCGTPVRTFICTDDGSANYISKKSALLNEKVDLSQHDLHYNKGKSSKIVYTSYPENKFLHFCWFYESPQFNTSRELNPIFKFNIHNNEIIGDIDSIQNLFWHKKIIMFRACCNELCESSYMAETEPLVLERKSKKFMPFHINLEGYTHKSNESIYFFFNSAEQLFRSNTILMKYTGDLTQGTIVTKLPSIDLSTIKTDINKKIKTILTFL